MSNNKNPKVTTTARVVCIILAILMILSIGTYIFYAIAGLM